MIKNEIKQYYDKDKTLLNISERSEFKLLKSYKNKNKIEKNLNYYAIFLPRKNILCSTKVYKIIGIEKTKTKPSKLELILDKVETTEEKFILSSYSKIINRKIINTTLDNRKRYNQNLFPAEITKSSVIDYFRNIN